MTATFRGRVRFDGLVARVVRMLVVVVCVGVMAPASGFGSVRLVATLSAPQNGSGPGAIAASAGTLVAAQGSSFGNGGGFVSVFSEPAGGWASGSSSATLSDPLASHGPYVPSISGGTVVANGATSAGQGFDDVFVEPAGGWSGTVSPAARLFAPDGGDLFVSAVSGNTVVALATNVQGTVSFADVFVEPPQGWSGTVLPVATLSDSSGLNLYGQPVFQGNAVTLGAGPLVAQAGIPNRGDVFVEPAGGWSGTVGQSPTLVDPPVDYGGAGADAYEPVAATGDTLASGLSVFRTPAAGWHGNVRRAAQVYWSSGLSGCCQEAFDGGLFAVSTSALGPEHQCPCQTETFLFSEPAGGWSGTIAAAVAIGGTTAIGGPYLALGGRTLFARGGTAIDVFDVTGAYGRTVPPPRVPVRHASGLTLGAPRLAFTIKTGANDPPLESFTFNVPRGLAFTRNRTLLAKYISIVGAAHTRPALRGRALVLSLSKQLTTVKVEIRAPALTESYAMIRRIKRQSERGRKNVVAFHAKLRTQDAAGDTNDTTLAFHVP